VGLWVEGLSEETSCREKESCGFLWPTDIAFAWGDYDGGRRKVSVDSFQGCVYVTVLSPLSGCYLGFVTELWHSRFVMCLCVVWSVVSTWLSCYFLVPCALLSIGYTSPILLSHCLISPICLPRYPLMFVPQISLSVFAVLCLFHVPSVSRSYLLLFLFFPPWGSFVGSLCYVNKCLPIVLALESSHLNLPILWHLALTCNHYDPIKQIGSDQGTFTFVHMLYLDNRSDFCFLHYI